MTSTRKIVFVFTCAYIVALIVVLCLSPFIPSFDQVGHLKRGCYWTDALVPFVECSGFWGYHVVAYIVNLPLRLLYLPVFGVAGIFRAPWIILHAAVVWAPIAYFAWYLLRYRRSRTT